MARQAFVVRTKHVSTPQQYTLAIEHPDEQRLDNFVAGNNRELLAALMGRYDHFSGLWIYGAVSSGRSHLLCGRCLEAQAAMQPTLYIKGSDYKNQPDAVTRTLTKAGQDGTVVAIDDIGLLVGDPLIEAMLMVVYQRLLHEKGTLLLTHTQPAMALTFATADLASRMRSLQHFQIQPLSDTEKKQLLEQRADARGYDLSQPVLDYWLARGPRDLGALLRDLDTLDAASLAQKQRVTIPLLKEVLGY